MSPEDENIELVNFIANARLKDVVGKGLIISDYIAIIELIKNSKDAGSSSVKIDFQVDSETAEPVLVISDFGKGMSMEDIKYKWLNIAYSHKKNSINSRKIYAGNKGIGRFSCDRLGKELTLYTRKSGKTFISLSIDWSKFEVDDEKMEIGNIKASAKSLSTPEFKAATGLKAFKSGTILRISNLRSEWSLDKLRSLRKELERFIIDPSLNFKVTLLSAFFDPHHEVNQPIENRIFEDLEFRTTSIFSKIEENGKTLRVCLKHDGEEIFNSVERNPYSELRNISVKIYFLNQPAKAFFKRRTGYRSVEFGSIFLFLNGFRVFPYGSEGDDWLGIDRRGLQGNKRFFRTRDLVGFFEIRDKTETFSPVSSREGLVSNQAFEQLTSPNRIINSSLDNLKLYGYFHKLMRKLEKFVVDGLDWDRIERFVKGSGEEALLDGQFNYKEENRHVLEELGSIINIRTPSKHLVDVSINLPYLGELSGKKREKFKAVSSALVKRTENKSIDSLSPSEKRDVSKFISRVAKDFEVKEKTNKNLERKLSVETKRRIFAELESSTDVERIMQLHHQVRLVAGSLRKRYDRVVRKHRENPELHSKEKLISELEFGIFEIDKIRNVTKLASKADFDLSTNSITDDLVQYIQEYLGNFKDVLLSWNVKIDFVNPKDISIRRKFRPIEMSMLIDNIVSNAGKAGANKLVISIQKKRDSVIINFEDNGKGLTTRYLPDELFKKGISTTKGSGIGLNHIQKIVQGLKGDVRINGLPESGTSVKLIFQN